MATGQSETLKQPLETGALAARGRSLFAEPLLFRPLGDEQLSRRASAVSI